MSFRFQSDSNTREICKGLREAGAQVHYWKAISRTKGVPDLIVGFGGITYLLEVKSDGKKSRKHELSPEQVKFHVEWKGGPIATIRTLEEAKIAIGMTVPF